MKNKTQRLCFCLVWYLFFFVSHVFAVTYTPTNVLHALSSDGTLITVTEADGSDGSHTLQSVRFPSGGGTNQFGVISDPTLFSVLPHLVINNSGNAAVGWLELGTDGLYALKVATLKSSDSSYQTTLLSTSGEHVLKFVVKVDDSATGGGRISVVWYSYNTNTSATNAWIATSTFAGTLSPIQLL